MRLLILIFFAATLLGSCHSSIEPIKSITSEGFIEDISETAWMYGTHILRNNEHDILYALRSDKIDLDNFINRHVEIVGQVVEGYPVDGGPIFLDVTKITLKD